MFGFLIRRDAEGGGEGGGRLHPVLMQLMGLVLGDGCLRVSLRRSQGRDLGGRGLLLFGGGALLGDARLGIVRRVLVGYERSRGFLQAEGSV